MSFLPQYPQLTPAMRSVLERMSRAGYPPLYTQTPQQAKAAYEAGAGVLEVPKALLARVQDFRIPAHDGHALPARLYAPSDAVLPVLIYFHGGGFTIGSVASHDVLCRELSRLSGCAVVSLEYRLAPEHRHIDWFFDQYIDRDQREDWRFAPLNAPDVEGVAPTWFGLPECDPLVDDGLAYADKLRASGVAVDLEIYRGVTHEFVKMGRAIPEARRAHADAARALAGALYPDQ